MSSKNEMKNEKIVNKLKEYSSVLNALGEVNEGLEESGMNIKFDYHVTMERRSAIYVVDHGGNIRPSLVISDGMLEALINGNIPFKS